MTKDSAQAAEQLPAEEEHYQQKEHAQRGEWVAEAPDCRIRSIDGKKVDTEKAYPPSRPDCHSGRFVLVFVVAAAEKCGLPLRPECYVTENPLTKRNGADDSIQDELVQTGLGP
jgi:hypothetical protein